MYGPSNLASTDRFWNMSDGYHKKDGPRNICLKCYIFDNGDSYTQLPNSSPTMLTKLFGCSSLEFVVGTLVDIGLLHYGCGGLVAFA